MDDSSGWIRRLRIAGICVLALTALCRGGWWVEQPDDEGWEGTQALVRRRRLVPISSTNPSRALQDSASQSYNVTLVIALSYLNTSIAAQLEGGNSSNIVVSQLCDAVRTQVRQSMDL